MDKFSLLNLDAAELEGLPTITRYAIQPEVKTWHRNEQLRSFIINQFFNENGAFPWDHKKPTSTHDIHKENAFFHLANNLISMKLREGSIKWSPNHNAFVPTTEGLNTTLDITNWPYIQLPLLRQIYFSNDFLNLVPTQPVRSRTGTYFYIDVQKPEDSNNSIFDKDTYDVTYTNYTENADVNTLKVIMDTASFTTTERAIRTELTDMLMQDLAAEHSLDGFQEIMPFCAAELVKAESMFMLTTLLAASASFSKRETFNMNGYTAEEATKTLDVKGYRQTIVDKINNVAAEILINTGTTPTWIMTDVATWNSISANFKDQFVNANSKNAFSITGATRRMPGDNNVAMSWVGTLDEKYDVYVDNSGHTGLSNRIVVGATNSTWLKAGLMWLPFVIGWNPGRLRSYTKLFNQTEGIMNRSGAVMVNAQFYGDVTLTTS